MNTASFFKNSKSPSSINEPKYSVEPVPVVQYPNSWQQQLHLLSPPTKSTDPQPSQHPSPSSPESRKTQTWLDMLESNRMEVAIAPGYRPSSPQRDPPRESDCASWTGRLAPLTGTCCHQGLHRRKVVVQSGCVVGS
ncbi:hypothetical protein BCR33DRAFT_711626 [Rhizoclosmatium globosum]|uniref:Uncharacterized protein n=1 Tax=Rhizoclosmatium globosum TaxID=329046 RepID=A0A1Y2CZ15_9FUNG|nr:hypothetical protein BCR33DRAFT_711626 [Rhizoclosmatium globosum]|eukprot:ORY52283.1 hypothetical protein BCR33DRAFT_711626 [Rhizoclosmatium globosum]